MKKNYILIFATLFLNFNIKAQDTTQVQNINVGAEIVSSFIWRGQLFCERPSIQPFISYTNNKGNFTIGSWGSTSNDGTYQEVDFWATYEWKKISLSIWDYSNVASGVNYFEYDNKITTHAIEGILSYEISESFPLTLTAATFFYGADKKPNDSILKNNYSTYFELSYPITWNDNELGVFVGATPTNGYYGLKDFGIVNAGISATKQITFNNKYSIDINGSLIANPMAEKIYFVFGIKF